MTLESAGSANPEAAVASRRGDFLIGTDRKLIDLDVVHGFLTNCYWAKGISREVVARSIEHSLSFGVYEISPPPAQDASDATPLEDRIAARQVGFARVVSDFATVAYLGDVFILESHRGRGLSKWLMQCIVQHPALHNLRRWILLTRDAHRLYEKFGFTPLKTPDRYMELHQPDVYATS